MDEHPVSEKLELKATFEPLYWSNERKRWLARRRL